MTRTIRYVFSLIAVTALAAAGLCGCSGGSGTIAGEGKLDGKPLAGAEVRFEGDAKSELGGHAGRTDEQGKFLIQARSPIKPGKYRVLINKFVDPKGKTMDEDEFEQARAAGKLVNIVPFKYNHPAESVLIVDLKEGQNVLQPFDLKTKG